MATCPSCGEINPDRAKFCLNCATPLTSGHLARAEERKVVTVLFCDLVGFTARSDRADPEDVKATLRPFHTQLKREIEAFGGTLDKFIGDAALGVFGSHVSHEDDPERAVRAALAIRSAMDQLNAADPALRLAVRMGINTGEAVVAYGSGPQIGESVTGDVVNTASRLQSVAPVGEVVVGEPTYRATREVFVYEPMEPVSVKGKAEPLQIWRAIEARGRSGAEIARTHTTPFIGREQDLDRLVKAFARAVREASVQLVTIVGEPGVGKSRLVAELSAHIDALPDLVTWRQGRCLPYGEGVTFWPLSEIVKAHAGILDTDPPKEAVAKLDAVIGADEADREWMRQRLAPLIGVDPGSSAEREEAFTAWSRFLHSMAATGPAVLVFEDIHWADPAMLVFIEDLVERSAGRQMLVVCSARPGLHDRNPDWADTASHPLTIDVMPLTPDETARLIAALLDQAVLPADVQSLILDHAGGNPLYAEEFVRMLKDRDLLVRSNGTWSLVGDADVPFPESIQALIAARLDTLAQRSKALLQDASVIGKAFWSGAVEAMGERTESEVREALDELSRRELIHVAAESTMEGQAEYAFWHALVRDVCYSQIPRAARATKHQSAALWIERTGAGRVEDHAEVLAHHYTTALDLARAAGEANQVSELEAPALRFLVLAGDRALGLDVERAEAHYAKALHLAPAGHVQRPDVQAKWADAVRQAGRVAEAARALQEAVDAYLARGDRAAAARTLGTLSSVMVALGSARQEEVAAEAVRLLESEPPGPGLVAAYARMAGVKLVLGAIPETVVWADLAIALASDLGIEAPARVLGFRGYARCSLGDAGGIQDMRAALAAASERGEGYDAAVLYNNLGAALLPVEGPLGVLVVLREGIEFAERRGIKEMAVAMSASSLDQLVDTGEWDRALELADAIAQDAEATGDVAELLQSRWARARVLAARGDGQAAAPLVEWLEGAAREAGGVEDITAAFTAAASTHLIVGRPDRALALLDELDRAPNVKQGPTYPAFVPELVRTAAATGDLQMASRLVDGLEPVFAYRQHALCAARAILAEARADHEEASALYAEAAERWDGFGVVPERGHAQAGLGRSLLALGRPGEAVEALTAARSTFAGLRAAPVLRRTDPLLQRALAMSS